YEARTAGIADRAQRQTHRADRRTANGNAQPRQQQRTSDVRGDAGPDGRAARNRLLLRRAPAALKALQGGVVGLAGSYADHPLDVGDEDLAVAHLAGLGGLDDRLDDLIGEIAPHGDLDAGLGDEVDHVLGAPIELRVSPLPAETLHFRD